jgi:hypothetical protein
MRRALALVALVVLAAVVGCGGGSGTPDAGQIVEGPCQIADAANAPDSLPAIVCANDFAALASEPLDVTLPGARSVKVILDRAAGDVLYFQNSTRYEIHYAFASTHLSGNGLPVVGSLADFNSMHYFSPDRRFLLGAVTYYEQPQRWVLELAPYDTASLAMIETLFYAVKHAGFFGPALGFHPTSESIAAVVSGAPFPVVTTDEIYAGIDYQPLSLGTAVGRLHFTTAAALATEYVSYQDIVVLDEAPNDISVVQGIITAEFQTPLSHVNVLARNRHTPNMGLRGALANADLRAHAEQLVRLVVDANGWTITSATAEEAQAWWDEHAPAPVVLPPMDLTRTALVDISDVTPEPTGSETLRGNILAAVPAYGGKAAQYSILVRTDGVPIRKAFAIPVAHYHQFMTDHGFFDRVDALLADPQFTTDPATRDAALAQLRDDIRAAALDPELVASVQAKIAAEYTDGTEIRFRSSSNSEDLDGFPCAGCYNSYTGTIGDAADLADAIKHVWADVWSFRTFEIRTYYGVAHDSVGMALLVHHNFPDEEANGVAITANPYDASGLDPAFYVNVQQGGDFEVVSPPPGITSDQILYYFDQPNQPTAYLTHSNLIVAGTTVLSSAQLYQLGTALAAIRARFSAAYGPAAGNAGWYAMDVEFKFDDAAAPGATPALYVKQARPYPDPWAAQ